MAPLIKALGGRGGNQYIEKAVATNSGADIRSSDVAKIQNLRGIKNYLNMMYDNTNILPQMLKNPNMPFPEKTKLQETNSLPKSITQPIKVMSPDGKLSGTTDARHMQEYINNGWKVIQ